MRGIYSIPTDSELYDPSKPMRPFYKKMSPREFECIQRSAKRRMIINNLLYHAKMIEIRRLYSLIKILIDRARDQMIDDLSLSTVVN